MRVGISATFYAILFGTALCPVMIGQEPAWRPFNSRQPYTTIDDMLNKDAQASDSASIQYYGEDLAHLIVPDQAGTEYRKSFADRLAKAEQAARERKRKLVPESNIVEAFNALMKKVGAPTFIRANRDKLHQFRTHASTVGALPAIITANQNDTECYPGEAVFILWVLVNTDGSAKESYLDALIELSRPAERGAQFATSVEVSEDLMKGLSFLAAYETNHPQNQITRLFNDLAKKLGI